MMMKMTMMKEVMTKILKIIRIILNTKRKRRNQVLNPLSPNSVQHQFSPYNYPYTVKR